MIFVDRLQWRGAPWKGGASSHMISDTSIEELRGFAQQIGLNPHWYQRGSTPHFDLSPSYRKRAIAAGARPLERREFVEALRRYRAAAARDRREGSARYAAWLEAGPDRGPLTGRGS